MPAELGIIVIEKNLLKKSEKRRLQCQMQANSDFSLLNLKEKAIKQKNIQERSVPKFLKKIFYILEENKHAEYVSWNDDGLSMVIKKPTEFAERVLPLYFKHNNLASFVRQVI